MRKIDIKNIVIIKIRTKKKYTMLYQHTLVI